MDPLDRQLADAVNVDPSPEFVARVRGRVAHEASPVRTRWWPMAAAACLAAAIIAVALPKHRVDLAVPERPTLTASAPRVAQPSSAPFTTATVVKGRRRAKSPEVIVAAEDRRGLQALVDLVREGRVTVIFPEKSPDVEPLEVKAIVVSPIDIAPLAIASNTEQGDEQ
jgi:hypothetical protein